MHVFTGLLIAAGLGLTSGLKLGSRWDNQTRVAYTLSNDPSGSNILALEVSGSDGTVSSPTLTPTQGNGLLGLNAPGSSAGPDGLFGQGAVAVLDNYLFVVNPGSHTLSLFVIYPWDPLRPKLLGQPADTLGDFPMSVDYSVSLKQACVLNGGAKAGVACFQVDFHSGLSAADELRPLSAGFNATTPPTGPPLTTSDIVFNPSSSALFATVKGNAGATPTPGYIYAWPVDKHEKVSKIPVISSPPTLIMDFSIDFLGSDNSALLTDPSFGGSIISISFDLKVTDEHHTTITNQGAACWGAYSARFDSAYVVDSGHPNITILDPSSGAIKGVIQYENSAKGGFDTAIDRDWMYVLTGDSGVVVIELGNDGGKQVQHFELTGQGPQGNWQGMAVWPQH